MAEPQEVWYFDCAAPPERGGVKEWEVEWGGSGGCQAVAAWAEVVLFEDVTISTGMCRVGGRGGRGGGSERGGGG